MTLTIQQIGPAIMAGGLVLGMGYGTFVQKKEPSWKIPAVLCAGFWVFSAVTIYLEGFLNVIHNQTSNLWGNQIWYDLLFSVGLFWFAFVERAKKVGMPLLPWFIYVISVAGIGGLNMYARILYLEDRKDKEGDGLVDSESTSY
ncbi:MAG: hypothetical protein SGBAC_010225 [Bacillariaceae sp.]